MVIIGEKIDIETILSGKILKDWNRYSKDASLVPKPAIEIGNKVIIVDIGKRKIKLKYGIEMEKAKATR